MGISGTALTLDISAEDHFLPAGLLLFLTLEFLPVNELDLYDFLGLLPYDWLSA